MKEMLMPKAQCFRNQLNNRQVAEKRKKKKGRSRWQVSSEKKHWFAASQVVVRRF